ncbi:hypothetical protein BH11PSE11_BH11PSE11_39180 [soil metagenome]
MSDVDPAHIIHTRIWREVPEPDNAFATQAAYCRGYDVFGEMVGKARWIEMLVLLFRDDLPAKPALDMLEALAVALANPGPRDPSIHAAMSGGVCGSTAAAALMAALSVGAGHNGGARDVFDAMTLWNEAGTDTDAWLALSRKVQPVDIFPAAEHPPGFEQHGVSTSTIVRQLIATLVAICATPKLSWLAENRSQLEQKMGLPLALSGVAAAVLADLEFTPVQGEMLFLLLRLPGAAAHALEQRQYGYRQFPFYPVELQDDPATRGQQLEPRGEKQ